MSTQRKCIRRSQRGMSTQVIFHDGREPTQVEVAIGARNYKSGFAVAVLRRNLLHDILRGKSGNQAYTGGIAGEQFACERIDLVIRDDHALRDEPLSS